MNDEDIKLYAARYEWLREQFWFNSKLCVVVNPKDAVKLGHDCPALDRLDEMIDAARGENFTPRLHEDTVRLNFFERHCTNEGSIRLDDGSFKKARVWAVSAAPGLSLRETIDAGRKAVDDAAVAAQQVTNFMREQKR